VNVLLVAEESAGIQVLRKILDRGDPLPAVLTGAVEGRGATVGTVAQQAGVEVLDPRLVRSADFADWVRGHEIDLLLNVHSLFVIAEEVVAAPRIGSFNLHPGPLPRYAGLNAPSWAIYHGESRHGVTLHWMEPGIDTGAIAYQEEVEIADDETGLSLSLKCIRSGVPLVAELLETASEAPDRIPRRAQDLADREYFGREAPNGGRIDWTRPAAEIGRFVRAADYSPFPSPWGQPATGAGGVELGVVKAAATGEPAAAGPGSVGEPEGDGMRVAAADEWVLVQRVSREGRTMPAAEALETGAVLS